MMHFGKKGAVNYQYFPVREIWDVGVFGYVYIDAFHTSPFPSALINFFTGLYVFALFLYFSSKYFEIPVFSIGYVAIDVDKIKSSQDEKYIIAHEIGHIETGAFYNIYSPLDIRSRHEERADRKAIDTLVPWGELFEAFQCGIREKWELAEYFDVPEALIVKAVGYYRTKGFLN